MTKTEAAAVAPPRPRPGGRSARVRAAVLSSALAELVEKGPADFSVGAVAARAGVHPTSIYRRWATPEQLALDAALAAAAAHLPLPDSGSLRRDLDQFLATLATYVQSPLGRALLALSAATWPAGEAARANFWSERIGRVAVVFEQAERRGEIAAGTDHARAVELLVAPIYFHAVILGRPISAETRAWMAAAVTRALRPGIPPDIAAAAASTT